MADSPTGRRPCVHIFLGQRDTRWHPFRAPKDYAIQQRRALPPKPARRAHRVLRPYSSVHPRGIIREMETPRSMILRELSVPECLALLATSEFGRLAITQKALPALVPVRIQLVGDEVLVTSLVGDVVPLVARGVVALGTGTLGYGLPNEWTVEVCGFLRSSSDTDGNNSPSFNLSATNIRGWTTSSGPLDGVIIEDHPGP